MIKNGVKRVEPILSAMCKHSVVLIPPLPRFIFGGCCKQRRHAAGSGTENSTKLMSEKIRHVRHAAKLELQKLKISGWWLADTNTALGNSPDTLSDLKKLMAGDNVHFTGVGYSKIAVEIAAGISKLGEKMSLPVNDAKCFYWHGFASPNGACGPRSSKVPVGRGRGGVPAARGGGGSGSGRGYRGTNRPHPYSRR